MSERTIWRALIFHLFDHKMEINDDKLFENKFDTTEVCFFAKFGRVQLSLIINNKPKLALTFESILFANSYLIEWNSKKWSKTFWTISLSLADKTKNKMLRFVAQKKLEKTATKMAHTKHWAHPLSPFTASSFSWTRPFSICIKISQSVLQSHLQHQFISFSLSFVTTPTRRRQTGGRNFDGGGGQQTTANIFTSVFVRHFIRVLFVLFEGFKAIEPKKAQI